MDNKILVTNTYLDKEEITQKMIDSVNAVADGIKRIMPMVINMAAKFVKVARPFIRRALRKMRYAEMKNSLAFAQTAKQYPKLNHLANHAKTRRARNKNIKRLYKLGLAYYKDKYPFANNGDN